MQTHDGAVRCGCRLEVELLGADCGELAGHCGLVATSDHEAGTFLGEYEGRFWWPGANDTPAARSGWVGSVSSGGVGSVSSGGVGPMNDYTLSGTLAWRVWPNGSVSWRSLHTTYTIDPVGMSGNGIFEFSNDYRLDVRRANSDRANPPNRQNTTWVAVQRGPEPHMLIRTTRRIRRGEPVCTDYGLNFWTSRFAQFT